MFSDLVSSSLSYTTHMGLYIIILVLGFRCNSLSNTLNHSLNLVGTISKLYTIYTRATQIITTIIPTIISITNISITNIICSIPINIIIIANLFHWSIPNHNQLIHSKEINMITTH